ncbi:helix-turn-helix transcriptional regulator [Spongiimicrobium sp. 2-473A-2-J]|uniref:helix-turn-helix transcriptional regulator n=1 Tax=Eudoraea algarum TaxID=3417568 RepID=UPI003D36C039
MKTNKVSDFLGVTSDKFQNKLFSLSIVNYHQAVSEDWHYHENIHLSAILTGGNRESRKKEDIQVRPGKIMAYREGEIHRNRNTVFPSKNLNIELGTAFFDDEIQFSNLCPGSDAYLSLLKVFHEVSMKDTYSHESIRQILDSLFYEDDASGTPDWISSIKILLNDRWQEFISLDELSQELDLHPVSISKYFAKHAKCTLADYMRKIKIERAVHMIFDSRTPLTQIAHHCGFSDQSHMNRLFKYYVGFTPKSLRAI